MMICWKTALSELLRDEAIGAAADKVRITENEDYERQYPARSLARVTITLKNGTSYSQEDDRSARGRYLTPTDEDIERKFRMIAEAVLGGKDRARHCARARSSTKCVTCASSSTH